MKYVSIPDLLGLHTTMLPFTRLVTNCFSVTWTENSCEAAPRLQ